MAELNWGILDLDTPRRNALSFQEAQQARQDREYQNQLRQTQMVQADMTMKNMLRQQQDEEAMREAWRSSGGDPEKAATGLIGAGFGKEGMDVRDKMFKARAEKIKAAKDSVDLMKSTATSIMAAPTFENAVTGLQQFAQLTGIDVMPEFRKLQALGDDPEAIRQWAAGHALTADKLVPQFENLNLGGGVMYQGYDPLTGKPTGEGVYTPMRPLPADVAAQQERKARAGATNVNVGAEKEYLKKGAGVAGEADIAQIDAAPVIQSALDKVEETLDVLRKGNVNTGLGAEVFTTLDRARAQFAADKKAGKRVEDTQYLDALLGSEVFPLIQQLGIGARGMDTPAEREFLRKVMTGTINLDKNTLIRMAELRKKALTDQANRYNSRLASGELDAMLDATHRTKRKIEIPKGKAKQTSSLLQPMYAKNPKTGERIVSNDGGETWEPVR